MATSWSTPRPKPLAPLCTMAKAMLRQASSAPKVVPAQNLDECAPTCAAIRCAVWSGKRPPRRWPVVAVTWWCATTPVRATLHAG